MLKRFEIHLLASLLLICATAAFAQGNAGKGLKKSELRLDVGENQLQQSSDFAFFAPGHFGDKTQYMGRYPDEFGGAYAIHCRQAKPFSIEVKYQGDGISRDDAMKVMHRLLPPDAGDVIEHDDDDLKLMDSPQAAEFFYFKGGPRSELLYAKGSNKKVVQVNLWTKDG
jgi:hypothetical protein